LCAVPWFQLNAIHKQQETHMNIRNLFLSAAAAALFAATSAIAHEGHEHGQKEDLASGETKKITGEVVDMACYVDHNATGEKHADCAKKCITSGLPVGLKADDGKTYLLIGEHKPLNDQLAQYAAKKITVEGKVTSRDGIYMIENAVIQK
jgi:hypothetical protein